MDNIPNQTGRPQHARRLFIIIFVLACFGLLGGIINFSTAIRQPLSFTSSNPYIKNQLTNGITTTSIQDQQRLDALKTKDADGDNLTDYDELYVYNTSPYLKDSDSDGLEDNDEIKNNSDPNCPQGKACTPIALNTNAATTNSATTNQTNAASASSTPEALLDTNALRQALLDAGAPQEQLNNLSDADLITLYSQILTSDTSTNTNGSSNTNAASNSNSAQTTVSSVTYQQLQNMTATEIRQLLIQGGADATSLSQLDDASLKSIFLQSISNLKVSN